jgi:hypothetical protein
MSSVDDIVQSEHERHLSEWDSIVRESRSTILVNEMLANGAEISDDDNFPKKQAAQLWRAQRKAHTGSDDAHWTDLGHSIIKNRQRAVQYRGMIRKAMTFHPGVSAEHLAEFEPSLLDPRGSLNAEDFATRFKPYVEYEAPEIRPDVADLFTNCAVKVFNNFNDSLGGVSTPIGDYSVWKSQFKSGTNSGAPKFESLTTEQWENQYIGEMYDELLTITQGGTPEGTFYSNREYTMFARTPDRPIHGIDMLGKAAGSFLNFDLTNRLGVSKDIPMSWHSLERMFELGSEYMADVETTIHEDFSKFDSRITAKLNQLILDAFDQSSFLKGDVSRRNVFRYFLEQMTTPTDIRIAPNLLMKMRGSLYSGTPVTQIHGSIIHSAYLECLREHYGVDIHNYTVLSDDGMCYYGGSKADAQRDMRDHFIPFAEELNLVMNDKKSYIADLNVRKVMLSAGGEQLIRHESGPYLSKFIQRDADDSFGNIARLGRSLLGKERKTEVEAEEMLLQLLPGLRRTAKGDRAILSSWVPDFWRTLEVMAQIRPGYPRRREFIKKVVGLYPKFWKYYERLVEASASSGDALFDTPTIRPGGTSEKGTVRWLISYLNEVRDTGKWPI